MSYILEALKKAQAERQLGETPTIHAPALDTQAAQGGTPLKKPFVAALVALGIVSVGLAGLLWRQMTQSPAAPAPAPAPAPAAATSTMPAAAPPVATVPTPVAAPRTAVVPAPAPVVPKPAPEPVAPVAAPPVAAAPVSAPAPAPAPERKRPEPAGEEPVQALRDLPEPIQRAIPPIAMSGYMYSSNPADRLILIDKVLRHEGDEVAPGLVLVRLEPKGAVFMFRGYRYRIPY
ncbi:general secretion pathway protein B [Pseudoduganella flava]|uniref:General secretion pathway protein B n=1 Tax=Pseudoduganella flava TaxID=871742 RepID=A0A562Q4F1_9BURK|nr:general secretion pathway protein GspB [Pseudoduganella flava]QGZ41646.1 GspB domain-containing protein [Pseudoduganella flava]TWI51637.1 general secretion pathway protein B [Pseudoduganella flava]